MNLENLIVNISEALSVAGNNIKMGIFKNVEEEHFSMTWEPAQKIMTIEINGNHKISSSLNIDFSKNLKDARFKMILKKGSIVGFGSITFKGIVNLEIFEDFPIVGEFKDDMKDVTKIKIFPTDESQYPLSLELGSISMVTVTPNFQDLFIKIRKLETHILVTPSLVNQFLGDPEIKGNKAKLRKKDGAIRRCTIMASGQSGTSCSALIACQDIQDLYVHSLDHLTIQNLGREKCKIKDLRSTNVNRTVVRGYEISSIIVKETQSLEIHDSVISRKLFVNKCQNYMNITRTKFESGWFLKNPKIHFNETNIMQSTFSSVNLYKIKEFKCYDRDLTELQLRGVVWPSTNFLKLSEDKNINTVSKRETYAKFKNYYNGIGDSLEAEKFYCNEMRESLKSKLEERKIADSALLFLGGLVSNHGTSFSQSFFSYGILLAIFSFGFIYFQRVGEEEIKLAEAIMNFAIPIRKIDPKYSDGQELFIYFSRVIFTSITFHLLISSRKMTRK